MSDRIIFGLSVAFLNLSDYLELNRLERFVYVWKMFGALSTTNHQIPPSTKTYDNWKARAKSRVVEFLWMNLTIVARWERVVCQKRNFSIFGSFSNYIGSIDMNVMGIEWMRSIFLFNCRLFSIIWNVIQNYWNIKRSRRHGKSLKKTIVAQSSNNSRKKNQDCGFCGSKHLHLGLIYESIYEPLKRTRKMHSPLWIAIHSIPFDKFKYFEFACR